MERRQVATDVVVATIDNPEQAFSVSNSRMVAQSRVSTGQPPVAYLIRVFVDVDRVPAVVVTVYRTSKIEKYWRTT
jgi:hypothetical protein